MDIQTTDRVLLIITLALKAASLLVYNLLLPEENRPLTLNVAHLTLLAAVIHVYLQQSSQQHRRMEAWKAANPRLVEMARAHAARHSAGPERAGPLVDEMARAALLLEMDPDTVANLAAQYFQTHDQRPQARTPRHTCMTCWGGERGLPLSLCPLGLRAFLKNAAPAHRHPKNKKRGGKH